jgi:hypothetical protein
VGRSSLDKLVSGPPSTWGHFDRRLPIVDPVSRGVASRRREGVIRGRDRGGSVTSRSIYLSLKDTDLGGDFCCPAGGAPISLSPHEPTRPH